MSPGSLGSSAVGETDEQSEEQKTIVLAQKEPQDQRFLTALLDSVGGFEVVGAMSASGVIRGLLHGPDLILVDPHVRGNFLRAVELMRRMPKLNHVAIAAVTGDHAQAQRCAGNGFNGFISKPFRPEARLAMICLFIKKVMARTTIVAEPATIRSTRQTPTH